MVVLADVLIGGCSNVMLQCERIVYVLCCQLKSASLHKWLEKALDTLQDLKKSKLAPGYNAALIMLPCHATLERRAMI